MLPRKQRFNTFLKSYVFTIILVIATVVTGEIHTDTSRHRSVVSVQGLAGLPALRDIVVKEGASTLIECNVSGIHDDILWYNSKGHILDEEEGGGKWLIRDKGILNITTVTFEDRGRYTCIASSSTGTSNYTITLRVAYTHSGLGLYYVIVCLIAFTVTMILNITRLCMVGTHLRKTERAINEFFRTEGAEKLQKAFEIAKRIPIITSAKTLELAKVTQFKTMEFARHIEELARSVPLPPLILNCRAFVEDMLETVHHPDAAPSRVGPRPLPAIAAPGPSGVGGEVCSVPPSHQQGRGQIEGEESRALHDNRVDIEVSVHPLSECQGEEAGNGSLGLEEAEVSVSMLGTSSPKSALNESHI